jgi:Tol biopolymer transport system component
VVDAIVTARDQAAQTPAANYGVSDTGTLVYLTGARLEPPAPRGTLVWVDRRGREELIANAPVRAYDSPRLSPNGKQIALVIREEQPDVWIWDVVRGNLSKFTSGGKANWLPVWEPPTGRRLFWASNRGNGNADRTGAVHRLTDSRNSQRPTSFTQDGSLLLFAEAATGSSQADLNADLKMLAMSGDPAPKTLVPTPASEISPELSPDDRWLAYQSNETGQDEIYVVPFPVVVGAERKQVSLQGGREPLWSQNRREIFFLAPDGALMAAPVSVGPRGEFEAGVPVQVIAPGPYFLQAAFHRGRTYDASSDGSRFLRIKVDQVTGPDARPRQFVVVQGWFEELKRLVPTR